LLILNVGHAPVWAARPGFDILCDNVIDDAMLDGVARTLAMSPEQYEHFRRDWQAYFDSIKALDKALSDESLEIIELWHERRNSPEPMTEAEINAPAVFISRSLMEGDARLSSLLVLLTEILAPEQLEALPLLHRQVRYENWQGVDDTDPNMNLFGRRVNMLAFVERALAPSGSLAGLRGEASPSALIADAIEAYQVATDEVLREDHRLLRRTRELLGDERERVFRGQVRGRLAAEVGLVRRISEIAREHLDESAVRRFESEYWAHKVPRCLTPLWLEQSGMLWLQEHREIDPLIHDAVAARIGEYLLRAHESRRAIFDAGIEARWYYSGVYGSEPRQIAFARAMLADESLHRKAIADVETLLPVGGPRESFQGVAKFALSASRVPPIALDAVRGQ